jgi:hypothetical protein
LRPGNTGTWAGSEELWACCLLSLTAGLRELRVRADSGFGCAPVLEMLEQGPVQYAIVARMNTSLKRKLGGLAYERLNPWEIAEGEHHLSARAPARRCIVARRQLVEADPIPTLFTLARYAYRAWITNLSLTRASIWHFYDGRAGMEPRIGELRDHFALRKILTGAFAANTLYLEVIRLACNLVTAFQRTCLPPNWQDLNLRTLRYKLFWLPAELTRPQNRPILRFANSSLIAKWAEQILHRNYMLKPLAPKNRYLEKGSTAANPNGQNP